MTANDAPPPVCGCDRVVAYAKVDDLPWVEVSEHYVDGVRLGRVPRLLLVRTLQDDELLLCYCDEQWQSISSIGAFETLEAAHRFAERRYPGVGARWIEVHLSREGALALFDETNRRCSFCSRRIFEMSGMIENEKAAICYECVQAFAREQDGE